MHNFQLKLKHFEKLFLVLIFLLPIETFTIYLLKIPKTIQIYHIFVFLGLLFACICYIRTRKIPINKTILFLYIGYCTISILSMFINLDKIIDINPTWYVNNVQGYSKIWDMPMMSTIYRGVIKPFELLFFIISLFYIFNIPNIKYKIIKVLIVITWITSIYSIYQIFAYKFNLPFGLIFSNINQTNSLWTVNDMCRVSGLFFEPGTQAIFLTWTWILLLSQFFEKNKFSILMSKKHLFVLFVCTTIALIYTISPIAYIAMNLGTAIYFILAYKQLDLTSIIKQNFSKVVCVLLCLIICLSIILIKFNVSDLCEYIIDKIKISLFSMNDPIIYLNQDSRSVRLFGAMETFKDHIMWGIGPGNSGFHYYHYVPFVAPLPMNLFVPFINAYSAILGELGIMGMIFFLPLILYPCYIYIKNKIYVNYSKNIVTALMAAYIITISISFMSLDYPKLPTFWIFYILLVLLIKTKHIKLLQ